MALDPARVRIYLAGGQTVDTYDDDLSEDFETAVLQVEDKLREGRWQRIGSVCFHTQSISAIDIDYEVGGNE